jgi:hypothetical protein
VPLAREVSRWGGEGGTEEFRALAIEQISVFMSIKRNVSPLQGTCANASYHTFNFDLVISNPIHTCISRLPFVREGGGEKRNYRQEEGEREERGWDAGEQGIRKE